MKSNLKFVFGTCAVLIAGALLVSQAAAVVSRPPAEQTFSSGERSVPALLGQDAEEIVFSPWTKYDMDDRIPYPFSDWQMFTSEETSEQEWVIRAVSEAFAVCEAMGITLDQQEAVGQMECSRDLARVYLKNMNLGAGENLTFAAGKTTGKGNQDFSLVVSGSHGKEDDAASQTALQKVKDDLRNLILSLPDMPDLPPEALLSALKETDNGLGIFLASLADADQQRFLTGSLFDLVTTLNPMTGWSPSDGSDLSSLTLEEIISYIQTSASVSLQILTLPSQILILYSLSDGRTIGIYYDSELAMYSGIAVN